MIKVLYHFQRQEIWSVSIKNPGLALEQMRRYILDKDERILKNASKKEESLFVKFWRDRDPTKGTSVNELMMRFS